ncbi:DUF418 domain-containing protein [Marinactinospora endophytica]
MRRTAGEPPPPSPSSSHRAPARAGVRADERALAPDLARGVMLLLIVVSNTAFHLWAAEHGPSGWHPIDGGTADRVVQFAMIVALDLRAYPLFAFLFGYGMAGLYLRQTAAGTPARRAVALVRRRGLWLVVFGFAHAALLMAGDIIGSYGLTSLVLATLFLRRGDRLLLAGCAVAAALVAMSTAPAVAAVFSGDLAGLGAPAAQPSFVAYAAGEDDALAAVGTRLVTWTFVTLGGAALSFGGHLMMLLGIWAARRRVLEEPGRHLVLLAWTAAAGITVGWLGGLPSALAHVGLLRVPAAAVGEQGVLQVLQSTTGLAGGLGYVALFGLIAHWWSTRSRGGPVVTAIAAAGERSLSCYLTHSLLFSPLLAAWGLGLGAYLGSASMAALATAIWLVTVAGAYALHRAGRPGPAEALMRRLLYNSLRGR